MPCPDLGALRASIDDAAGTPAPLRDHVLACVSCADTLAELQRNAELAALPERQRACLLLRHAGYSYAEIAATLDLAIGSVGVLLARGERAFRDAYLDTDDPDRGAHDALP